MGIKKTQKPTIRLTVDQKLAQLDKQKQKLEVKKQLIDLRKKYASMK